MRGETTRYGTREWEWDPSHFPLPLTPSFASLYLRWQERAFRVTCAEFGILAETLEARTRDGYLYTRVKPLGLNRPPPAWLAALGLRFWWLHPALHRRVRRAVRRVRADHSSAVLERWERAWRPAITMEQRRLRSLPLASLDDAALAGHLSRLVQRVSDWVTVHFLLHAAISLPLGELEEFLARTPALTGLRLADLLQGASHASSEPARELEGVAAPLRTAPALVSRATALAPPAALALLRRESPAFAVALETYLERHGQGIAGRYELIVPALAEGPETILPSILRLTGPSSAGSADATGEMTRRVEDAARRLPDATLQARFRTLVRRAQRAYAVRDENVQLTFSDAFGLVRLALLEAGTRLAARGVLVERDDIFFLRVPETLAALGDGSTVAVAQVEARRGAWGQAAQTRPPRSVGRPTAPLRLDGLPAEARHVNRSLIRYMREIMAAPDVYAEREASTMSAEGGVVLEVPGVAAVRGRYTGVARVLRGEADFDRLGAGEVLVCPMTSPAWAPLLPLAGALVTDHGGVLSHAAVIAREFGIPAVVATGRATSLIADGAIVEVDGERGLVRLLASPAVSPLAER